MNLRGLLELGLTVVALGAFTYLAVERYRTIDRRRMAISASSRLLLMDVLLMIAGVEMVADALVALIGRDTPLGDLCGGIATVGRGALIAGALALVATFSSAARTGMTDRTYRGEGDH